MYRLLQGQSLEILFNHSLKEYPAYWKPSFLTDTKTLVILQNQNVIRWVQTRLAQATGACGGLDMKIPDQALRGLLDALDWAALGRPQPPLLFMDSLKLLVLHHLEEAFSSGDPVWDDLRAFVGDTSSSPARRFGLANALAGSLSHYAQNEISIPRAWRSGLPAVPPFHPAAGQEAWQKDLWFRCFPPGSGPRLLGSLLDEIMDSTPAEEQPFKFQEGRGWNRILILGSPFLSRQAMAFLQSLGKNPDLEILHFLLVPGGPEASIPLANQEPQSGWSRLYSGFREDLEKYPLHPENLPSFSQAPGMLGSLQNRLRGNPENFSLYPPPGDGSLEFNACTTPVRQLEVLKDRLNILLKDPSLSPQDIAVMAPDLSLFSPFIETVFDDEASGKLPHNIQHQGGGHESRISALKQMVALGSGRLTRMEVLELCAHPAFAAHHRIESRDYESLQNFLEETNTLWGWDEDHRKTLIPGYSGGENTWQRAQDRLALAMAYGSEDILVEGLQGQDIPALVPDQKKPAEILDFLSGLRRILQDFSRQNLPLGEWCRKIQSLAEEHLGPWKSQDNERDELETVLQRIQSQAGELPPEVRDRTWSWDQYYQIFLDQAERLEAGAGAFLVRGINFFSFRPLRTLPFQVIALLGMDEGAFPTLEQPASFDLRNRERTAVDQESTDLFTFLETIMAAGKKLMIFWRGRDEVTGETRPPAAPVQDLLDLLEESSEFKSEDYILKATVNGYSPENFLPGKDHLAGTSLRDYEIAKMMGSTGGKKVTPGFPGNLNRQLVPWNGPLPPARWSLLLTASLRFALQSGSGIYFQEESEHRETENFALDFFQKREFFQAVLAGLPGLTLEPFTDHLLRRWELKGAWGNQALKTWEQKDLQAMGQRLQDLLISQIPPGSILREQELLSHPESLMQGKTTWIETPGGGVVIPVQTGSSLSSPSASDLAFRHRVGALMGWLGALSQGLAGSVDDLTVLFYNGTRSQILPWKPQAEIFRDFRKAGEFMEDLKALALDMIASPFPLYPQLLEKFLLGDPGDLTAEVLDEAWETWKEDSFSSGRPSGQDDSVLWTLLDRPGTCPYLRSAWPEVPPWEAYLTRMEAAGKKFYSPFLAPKEKKN